MNPCLCYSQKPYSLCCKPLHDGTRPAGNALELMRSRYSAYATGNVRYLVQTTHKNNPLFKKKPAIFEADIRNFCLQTSFDGLQILEFIDGEAVAFVTFFARIHQGAKDCSFTEKSRFLKVSNLWLYESGVNQSTPNK